MIKFRQNRWHLKSSYQPIRIRVGAGLESDATAAVSVAARQRVVAHYAHRRRRRRFLPRGCPLKTCFSPKERAAAGQGGETRPSRVKPSESLDLLPLPPSLLPSLFHALMPYLPTNQRSHRPRPTKWRLADSVTLGLENIE